MRQQKTDRGAIDILKSYFSKLQIADKDADLDRDPYVCAAWAPKTLSNGAVGMINWVTDFGLPEIPKLVFLYAAVRDSASAGGFYHLQFKAKATTTNDAFSPSAEAAANDQIRPHNGYVPVADDGTTRYNVIASGVNTMDAWLRVTAWVP